VVVINITGLFCIFLKKAQNRQIKNRAPGKICLNNTVTKVMPAAGLSALPFAAFSLFCRAACGLIPIAAPSRQNMVARNKRVPLQSLPVLRSTLKNNETMKLPEYKMFHGMFFITDGLKYKLVA
jgi:hypothetical protein